MLVGVIEFNKVKELSVFDLSLPHLFTFQQSRAQKSFQHTTCCYSLQTPKRNVSIIFFIEILRNSFCRRQEFIHCRYLMRKVFLSNLEAWGYRRKPFLFFHHDKRDFAFTKNKKEILRKNHFLLTWHVTHDSDNFICCWHEFLRAQKRNYK